MYFILCFASLLGIPIAITSSAIGLKIRKRKEKQES